MQEDLLVFVAPVFAFSGVKDSRFGRFTGVEDRFWPYVKTMIPKGESYPGLFHPLTNSLICMGYFDSDI